MVPFSVIFGGGVSLKANVRRPFEWVGIIALALIPKKSSPRPCVDVSREVRSQVAAVPRWLVLSELL